MRPVIAQIPTGPVEIPALVHSFLGDRDAPIPVWRNELGGLTFRAGDRYLKWNPLGNGIDLEVERARLTWVGDRHPVPRVLDLGRDDYGQLLVTAALDGTSAVATLVVLHRAAAGQGA